MRTTFILLVLYCAVVLPAPAQEIAITFDDAPTPNSPMFNGNERAERILRALRENGVDQAAFFVITSNMRSKETRERIKKYADAGHLLGNHSHSHRGIDELGVKNYCADISKADSILRQFSSYKPWFRFPFLDEGRTNASRDSIRQHLQRVNLVNGYATVDDYDWYINRLLQNALSAGKKVNHDALRKMYIDHIIASVEFYDRIALETLKRSPRHVLLLHENDVSALYVGDLIKSLKARGWKIISPELAYQDPIATVIPDVLFNNQGRVAAIARSKGVPARQLVQESEDEIYLDKVIEAAFR